MEGGKKILLVVILLVVIAGGIVLTVRKARSRSQAPVEVGERPIEMIDSDNLELISQTWKEWKADGKQDGMYMNPKTKQYTMVMPADCFYCGAKCPSIPPPAGLDEIDPYEADQVRMEYDAACENQKCVECGQLLNAPPPE
jgi:hypothetical protein